MIQYQVSFGDAVSRAFSSYCCFKGRASRSEYWWFVLFNVIIGIALSILGKLTGSTNMQQVLPNLFSLAVLFPNLGLVWRRLHDVGLSGAFYLWSIIPSIITGIIAAIFSISLLSGSRSTLLIVLLACSGLITLIAAIVVFVKLCKPSQPAPNKYGDVPNLTEA